jgi:hypothetical protein
MDSVWCLAASLESFPANQCLLCYLLLLQTLNVHTDSVWCLAASPDFSVVYSGGRDQALYATHMARRKAWLLARESQPIRSIVSGRRCCGAVLLSVMLDCHIAAHGAARRLAAGSESQPIRSIVSVENAAVWLSQCCIVCYVGCHYACGLVWLAMII